MEVRVIGNPVRTVGTPPYLIFRKTCEFRWRLYWLNLVQVFLLRISRDDLSFSASIIVLFEAIHHPCWHQFVDTKLELIKISDLPKFISFCVCSTLFSYQRKHEQWKLCSKQSHKVLHNFNKLKKKTKNLEVWLLESKNAVDIYDGDVFTHFIATIWRLSRQVHKKFDWREGSSSEVETVLTRDRCRYGERIRKREKNNICDVERTQQFREETSNLVCILFSPDEEKKRGNFSTEEK